MMDNIIMALSNLYCLVPIYYASTTTQRIIIFLAGLASFIYHLCEKHKHGLSGIGYFDTVLFHRVLINIDRFFAILAVYYFFDFQKIDRILVIGSISLVCMSMSELVFKSAEYKYFYMILHILWHIGAFHTIVIISKD